MRPDRRRVFLYLAVVVAAFAVPRTAAPADPAWSSAGRLNKASKACSPN